MRIAVLGAGMMGSALCVPLADSGHEVHLVGTHLDGEIIAGICRDRVHPKLKVELPEAVEPHFVEQAREVISRCEALVLGVSSAGVVWAGEMIAGALPEGAPILSVAKGLHAAKGRPEVLPDLLDRTIVANGGVTRPSAAVVGPCIAGELARRVDTCVLFTGREETVVREAAGLFHASYYHVRTSPDVTGLEVCAALKNGYALAHGYVAGLHEREGGEAGSVAMHNVESAVFTQALAEMRAFLDLLGVDPQAVLGLAGAGDLLVTCQGGRTGRFGRWLGLGLRLGQAVERMEGATLECLDILEAMRGLIGAWEQQGLVGEGQFPLGRFLVDVAVHDLPRPLPVGSFFG
jgi:glycerol-3-phosphate dehydrogenase (NAD(P)+)